MLFSRRYLLICSTTLQYEAPEETGIRWSGSTIQEMLENVRNFPEGMGGE